MSLSRRLKNKVSFYKKVKPDFFQALITKGISALGVFSRLFICFYFN